MAFWNRKEKAEEAAPSAPPKRPVTTGTQSAVLPDSDDLMKRCCEREAAATIMAPELGIVRGRFKGLRGENVILEVLDPPSHMTTLTLCCVSFDDDRRACVFITRIHDVMPPSEGSGLRIVIERPEQVAAAEARRSFRIPVVADAKLAVTMGYKEQSFKPRPLDLSLGGMLVELPKADATVLSVGDKVVADLALEDDPGSFEAVSFKAEVRRVDEGRVGLAFPEVFQGGEIKPPPEYRKIIVQLERLWLRQRNA